MLLFLNLGDEFKENENDFEKNNDFIFDFCD